MHKLFVCFSTTGSENRFQWLHPMNQMNLSTTAELDTGSTKNYLGISLPCTRPLEPHENKLMQNLSQEGEGSWQTLSSKKVPRGSAGLGLYTQLKSCWTKTTALNKLSVSASHFTHCPTAPLLFVFSHWSISAARCLERSQGITEHFPKSIKRRNNSIQLNAIH